MAVEPTRLENRRVGDLKPIIIETTVRAADKDPSSAQAIGYDPKKGTTRTSTNAGSTSTLSAGGLTGADDKWNGMPVGITTTASGLTHQARVTDWDLTAELLTFTTLSEPVVQGDSYEIMGEPLMLLAAASVSGNDTTVNLDAALHGYAGPRRLEIEFTFSGSDVEWREYEYEVIP